MAQNYTVATKYGKITVSRNAIAKAAVDSLEDMGSRVILCSRRGKILKKNGAAEFAAVEVESIQGDIRLTVNVIVKFGISITKTADDIAGSISEAVRRTLGKAPSVITVMVRGVISQNKVAPRNLTIRRELEVQGR